MLPAVYWLFACKKNWFAPESVAPEPWADQRLVAQAAILHCQVLKSARPDVWANRPLLLSIAKQSSRISRHGHASLRDDRELVLDSMRRGGNALAWVSPRLRADGHVVLPAVGHVSSASTFAAPALRSDREFVRPARTVHMCETIHHWGGRPQTLSVATVCKTLVEFRQLAAPELQVDQGIVCSSLQKTSS